MTTIEEQARSIFLAALERVPEESPAFLDQGCGSNAELRGRVEQLLDAHRALGSIHGVAAIASALTTDEPLRESPGTVIGPYKLLEAIGEGAFGAVFMAEQTQPVRRKVALKILKLGMDTRQVVARFEAERQALAIMDHPNIAKVHDGGATASGRPYFVMELVKGAPITEFCDQNQLTPRQRLELFIAVCQAVQHAHHKGIIHRDLKPSNILVTVHDTRPVVKVIDFGIAKALGQELTDKTLFTGFAQMIGTPLYMSPEQAGESGLDIDTRSDIYSLGVLLYELLTGTTPFDKARFKEAAYDEIRRIIREEDPPKPSTRLSEPTASVPPISTRRLLEAAKLTRLVRGELDWIVMKALEKDRNRRYETANGFAADVQRYLNNEPVQACPPSAWYRLSKFGRRNRAALAMAGVIAASLVIAVGSLLVGNAALAAKQHQTEAAKRQTEAALEDKTTTLRELKRTHEKLEQTSYVQGIALTEVRWLNAEVLQAEKELRNCPPSLRGWEWHYLKRLCRSELEVFDQGDPLVEIQVSPDGQRLAALGFSPVTIDAKRGHKNPAEMKVWDLRTGRLLFSHVGKRPNWQGVAASPDCLWVASFLEDDTVEIWDVARAKKVWTVKGLLKGKALLFDPAGKQLATKTADNGVYLWDLDTGGLQHTLPGHGAELASWAFSSDGRQLATTGYVEAGKLRGEGNATIHVWDLGSGKKRLTLAGGIDQVSFSPDGRSLAALTPGGHTAKLWDLTPPSGQLSHTLKRRGHNFFRVAFRTAGLWLASRPFPATHESDLTLWDTKTGQLIHTLKGDSGRLGNPVFGANGQWLAAADGKVVRIWDAGTGQEKLALRGHHAAVNGVAFLADGRLASAADRKIRLWDITSPQECRVLHHSHFVHSAVFSPNGLLGASACLKEVQVWSAQTGKEIASWKCETGQPPQLHFSPDSKRIAALHFEKEPNAKQQVKVWEAATGKEALCLEGQRLDRCLAFSSDGKHIASAGGEFEQPSDVWIWDAATGKNLKRLAGHGGPVLDVVFSPDGRSVAAAGPGMKGKPGELRVWDLATGKEAFSTMLMSSSFKMGRVLFSPDGKRLACASGDFSSKGCELKVWELASGQELLIRNLRPENLGSVAFSPDSRLITSSEPAFPGKTVLVWEIGSGREVARLQSDAGQVWRLAFNPKGNRIATATADGTVRVWDVFTGQEMLILRGHTNIVKDLTFSADGHRIATASMDRTVRVWDAAPSD